MTIFTGGMPRANYGDRQCLSVIHESIDHVTFDFTSRIVDYFVFNNKSLLFSRVQKIVENYLVEHKKIY